MAFFNKRGKPSSPNVPEILASLFPSRSIFYSSRGEVRKEQKFPFAQKTQNVFLASNSIFYGIDKVSRSATGTPPIVVLTPMWLEKVNSRHYKNKWGQTSLGLPTYPRQLFNHLYPNHPIDHFLTWEQLLQVRQLQAAELEKAHKKGEIVLYDLRGADLRKYERGELLSFKHIDHNYVFFSDSVELFKVKDNQTMVYNFLSRPVETTPAQGKLGLRTRPHTDLYCLESHEVPKALLIVGTGLSSVWIRKHFPAVESLFILTKNKQTAKLPKIPSNENVGYESIQMIDLDDLRIDKDGILAIYDLLLKKDVEVDPAAHFFTAIGYSPYSELTDCIPEQQKMLYSKGDDLAWTAPRNIPKGSLAHRLMLFYSLSEIYCDLSYVYEMQYYVDAVTPMQVQKRSRENEIELDSNFFDRLRVIITELPDPVSKEKEIDLYIQALMPQHPSLEEQERFKSTIQKMQQEIEDRNKLLLNDELNQSQEESNSPSPSRSK